MKKIDLLSLAKLKSSDLSNVSKNEPLSNKGKKSLFDTILSEASTKSSKNINDKVTEKTQKITPSSNVKKDTKSGENKLDNKNETTKLVEEKKSDLKGKTFSILDKIVLEDKKDLKNNKETQTLALKKDLQKPISTLHNKAAEQTQKITSSNNEKVEKENVKKDTKSGENKLDNKNETTKAIEEKKSNLKGKTFSILDKVVLEDKKETQTLALKKDLQKPISTLHNKAAEQTQKITSSNNEKVEKENVKKDTKSAENKLDNKNETTKAIEEKKSNLKGKTFSILDKVVLEDKKDLKNNKQTQALDLKNNKETQTLALKKDLQKPISTLHNKAAEQTQKITSSNNEKVEKENVKKDTKSSEDKLDNKNETTKAIEEKKSNLKGKTFSILDKVVLEDKKDLKNNKETQTLVLKKDLPKVLNQGLLKNEKALQDYVKDFKEVKGIKKIDKENTKEAIALKLQKKDKNPSEKKLESLNSIKSSKLNGKNVDELLKIKDEKIKSSFNVKNPSKEVVLNTKSNNNESSEQQIETKIKEKDLLLSKQSFNEDKILHTKSQRVEEDLLIKENKSSEKTTIETKDKTNTLNGGNPKKNKNILNEDDVTTENKSELAVKNIEVMKNNPENLIKFENKDTNKSHKEQNNLEKPLKQQDLVILNKNKSQNLHENSPNNELVSNNDKNKEILHTLSQDKSSKLKDIKGNEVTTRLKDLTKNIKLQKGNKEEIVLTNEKEKGLTKHRKKPYIKTNSNSENINILSQDKNKVSFSKNDLLTNIYLSSQKANIQNQSLLEEKEAIKTLKEGSTLKDLKKSAQKLDLNLTHVSTEVIKDKSMKQYKKDKIIEKLIINKNLMKSIENSKATNSVLKGEEDNTQGGLNKQIETNITNISVPLTLASAIQTRIIASQQQVSSMMSHMAKKMYENYKPPITAFRINLIPAQLGTISIIMKKADKDLKGLNISLNISNSSTLDLFKSNETGLKSALLKTFNSNLDFNLNFSLDEKSSGDFNGQEKQKQPKRENFPSKDILQSLKRTNENILQEQENSNYM